MPKNRVVPSKKAPSGGQNASNRAENVADRFFATDSENKQKKHNFGRDRFFSNAGSSKTGNRSFEQKNEKFRHKNNQFELKNKFGSNDGIFGSNNSKFGSKNDDLTKNRKNTVHKNNKFSPKNDKFGSKNDNFGSGSNKFAAKNNEFGSKNETGTKTNEFVPKKGKFSPKKQNFGNMPKNGAKLKTVNDDKFRKIEEDSEYTAQFKNKCRDVVKFRGGRIEKNFDKKKWRLQKYSKKYKLDQFEERRKKTVLREYYQQVKDDKPKLDVKKIYEEYDESGDEKTEEKPKIKYVLHPDVIAKYAEEAKMSTKKKVQLELERIKQEKVAKKEELVKQKKEREEALKMYKLNKIEKHKKLNKKTKRGQPVMKGRIEMLLDQIQNG